MLIPTEQTRIHPPVTKRKESPGALSCSLQSPSEVLTGALTSLTWLNKIWFGSLPSRLARSTSRDIYDDGVIDAMLRGACRLMFTFWLLRVWFDVMCMFTIWAFKQELRSSISLQHGWKSWAYITGQLDSSSLSLLFYNFLRVLFLMNRVFFVEAAQVHNLIEFWPHYSWMQRTSGSRRIFHGFSSQWATHVFLIKIQGSVLLSCRAGLENAAF